jgi:hypothetical protein
MNVLGSVITEEGVPHDALSLGLFLGWGIAGLGMATGWRWGWYAGFIIALASVALGVYFLRDLVLYGGDITNPGAPFIALYFFVVPGVLTLISLLTPRSRRWRRHVAV